MKRKWLLVVVVLTLSFLLCGCKKKEVISKEETKEPSLEERVLARMNEMSLEEKIGQLFVIDYQGETGYPVALDNLLRTVKPGGFILFKSNFSTVEGTKSLVKKIKETGTDPLLIGVDQEGGKVQRMLGLEEEVSLIPSMYDVGKTKDPHLSKEVARVVAEELRVLGINLDFAPVLDIYSNPKNTVIGTRSFGSDVDTVSTMGLSFAEGLQENGVIPVVKHFPGHGDTETDSHFDLPVVTKSKEELLAFELVPFRKAIEEDIEVIMIGHLMVPSIDESTPASLSKALITNVLKEELGFKGLVITDALNMGAITKNYTQEETLRMAINAGVDLLLMPKEPLKMVSKIQEMVEAGEISEERIDDSVRKILTLKYKRLMKSNDLDSSYLNSEEHQAVLKKIPTS